MPATSPDDLFADALTTTLADLTEEAPVTATRVQTAFRVLGLFGRDTPSAELAPLLAPTLAILEAAINGEDAEARQWAGFAVLDWESRFPAP